MSFGISIPFVSALMPEPMEIGPLNEKPFGTSENRKAMPLEETKRAQVRVHELSHFFDVFSTPLGCFVLLLEHPRIYSMLRLLAQLKTHAIASPIRLPVSDYILSLQLSDPTIRFMAEDHNRLRDAVTYLRCVYFGTVREATSVAQQSNRIKEVAHLIPIFNRHFFLPRFDPGFDDYLPNFSVSTNDLLEVLAMLSEFNMLVLAGVSDEPSDLDRFIKLFPRKSSVAALYTEITRMTPFQTTVFMHRYVLWKALHGPLCVPYLFDHGQTVLFSKQHPVLRLSRMLQALEHRHIKVPNVLPTDGSIDLVTEFDVDLSKAAGLETLEESRRLFLSPTCSTQWANLNPVEGQVARLMMLFYEHAGELFRSAWNDTADTINKVLVYLEIRKKGRRFEEKIGFKPLLWVDGKQATINDSRGEAFQKSVLWQVLMGLLLLELDSSESSGLFERFADNQIVRGQSGPRDGFEDVMRLRSGLCTELSGHSADQFDWNERLEGAKGRIL